MNGTTFRLPAAAVLVALAALPTPAHATQGDAGRANAAVLRTALDVSLLDRAVDIPLKAALNEVRAPASAEKTALTVTLDGVDRGKSFSMLRADTATARAAADAHRAEASTHLAHARLHVPGLPLLSLVELRQVTSRAVCEAGKRPVAESSLLGHVTVLGKKVTLTPGGPTRVEVPGIGQVALHLSKTHTTTRTAAATALSLTVSLNPLQLNVADVTGTLTLAEAGCTSPMAAPAPVTKPRTAAEPPRARADLAETGGGSSTPYVAGGALAVLAAGAGVLLAARRARTAHGRD
ncbi:SCO1860 family LAETG-anchored protein [Streptomyces sp. NPDC006368]|uniref:SCO1860 family LAETG-anchored protein n=1 Tax=Streptomyces sp. NPDC006368 TaxID=3156760 RepID=UPI0033B825E9